MSAVLVAVNVPDGYKTSRNFGTVRLLANLTSDERVRCLTNLENREPFDEVFGVNWYGSEGILFCMECSNRIIC